MEKKIVITLRRAVLNYQKAVENEELEGFQVGFPSELYWTKEDKERELANCEYLLNQYQI